MEKNMKSDLNFLEKNKEFMDGKINNEKYWEKRKKELREEIIKYRDTPIEKLIEDELLKYGIDEEYDNYLKSISEEMFLIYYKLDKKGKGNLSHKYGYENIQDKLKSFEDYKLAYSIYINELKEEYKKTIIDKITKKKEKYQGIADNELEEYLELLISKGKIRTLEEYEILKFKIKMIKEQPRKYKKGLTVLDAEYLEGEYANKKEEIKKELRENFKYLPKAVLAETGFASVFIGIIMLTSGSGFDIGTLAELSMGAAINVPIATGFISAIIGLGGLRELLEANKDKKNAQLIIEELKREGLYDAYTHKQSNELQNEIEEYEETHLYKGRR